VNNSDGWTMREIRLDRYGKTDKLNLNGHKELMRMWKDEGKSPTTPAAPDYVEDEKTRDVTECDRETTDGSR